MILNSTVRALILNKWNLSMALLNPRLLKLKVSCLPTLRGWPPLKGKFILKGVLTGHAMTTRFLVDRTSLITDDLVAHLKF